MALFLTKLVAKATEVFTIDYWRKAFADNYGKTSAEEVQMADEAFFKLLAASEHQVLADVILSNPSAFCRPTKIKAFMVGESVEKHRDDAGEVVETRHNYPAAPPALAEKIGEAVGGVMMETIEKLGSLHQSVSRSFWIQDPTKEGYCAETAPVAAQLGSAMHGLLNIAEGLGDKEGFEALAKLFAKLFGNLPGPVYYRIKGVLYPAQPTARPGVPKLVPETVDAKGESRPRQKTGKKTNGKHKPLEGDPTTPPPTPAEQLAAAAKGLGLGADTGSIN